MHMQYWKKPVVSLSHRKWEKVQQLVWVSSITYYIAVLYIEVGTAIEDYLKTQQNKRHLNSEERKQETIHFNIQDFL